MGWSKSRKDVCVLSAGLYISAPCRLFYQENLQENLADYLIFPAIIIAKNGSKVSIYQHLKLNQQTLNIFLGYGWGCTENASSATMRSNFETTSIGTTGAPLVQTIVSAFDPETLNEKQYNEEGELCINSKTIMMGYYNDKELTKNVIKTHADGSKWLHTGDLGTISKEGIVTINGRMTRVIFVFPTAKIYPQALESLISKVSGVREVAICEMPDFEHEGFYLPVCFIVADKKYNLEDIKDQIHKLCIEELPEYSRPRKVFFKDFLPLTKVGKPDVKALEIELKDQMLLNKQI